MLKVYQAESAHDIEIVRKLLREYQAALGVDLCFQGFEAELARLPGTYAPPTGRLLIASMSNQPIGCVALQRIDPRRGEMKRLYVRPSARGLGVGRALTDEILRHAAGIGYAEVVLDTLPSMREAQQLYEQIGFDEIEPYRLNPIPGTRYLRKQL